ncbi:hypothetical protein EJ06DRAFT_469557 [Trichodelitschia bisporula]|uniref:PRISE-like Rossmann-fold domain-containing protein n=1 Tax=Trichodelitschia bisporula TaxID=703511 RepID=A0A6G1I883_9PEZI|nr:hypothetical protein EJ06DRAFT_469557 [Trichodelitschia bisporula]
MVGKHALVFGASGISGWAITKEILQGYPSPDVFSKVTALTNRPLSKEASLWPDSEKLQLVSGVDLLTEKGLEGLEAELKERVKDVETVTHVYFFAYVMDEDPKKEIAINITLLERAVRSIEHLSPKLEFVVLPTGTKLYGVHLIRDFPFSNQLPLRETLPDIPEPHASQMFYYDQLRELKNLSEGKKWTWCEVVPDMIVGFVPNNNIYCLAQALALYLSLYRKLNGEGAEVPFPGTEDSWRILSNDSGQDIIARFSIFASLHPDKCGNGRRFNVADSNTPKSWAVKWPVICAFFGLKGVAPPPGGSGPQPIQYVADHFAEWQKLEKEYGLKTGRAGNGRSYNGFPYFIMTMFDFDRHMSLNAMHEAWGGEREETDVKGTWWTAFERFREAKIIP